MPPADAAPGADVPPLPRGIWGKWPAVCYVLPFAVFMIVGSIEGRLETPTAVEPHAPAAVEKSAADAEAAAKETPKSAHEKAEEEEEKAAKIPYRYYPTIYSIKIGLTVAAMLLVLPGYLVFPLRINAIAWGVGIVGAVLWVGICKLGLEQKLLVPIGLEWLVGLGARAGFNPLEQLKDNPTWAYEFLAIRLFGLIIVVPIIEEFFLRVFLVRYVMSVDWDKLPFGRLDRLGLITATAFPMLMHPAELFAALVWFSLITWLMLRTRNIWDCVAAHAVTNALMGAYVLATGEWQFM